METTQIRRPGTPGWIFIAVCIFAGLLLGASGNRQEGVEPVLGNGWMLLSPEWSYLVNAALPLGITLRLSSVDDPLESGTNLF